MLYVGIIYLHYSFEVNLLHFRSNIYKLLDQKGSCGLCPCLTKTGPTLCVYCFVDSLGTTSQNKKQTSVMATDEHLPKDTYMCIYLKQYQASNRRMQ